MPSFDPALVAAAGHGQVGSVRVNSPQPLPWRILNGHALRPAEAFLQVAHCGHAGLDVEISESRLRDVAIIRRQEAPGDHLAI